MAWLDACQALSIIVACFTGMLGISAWRREALGRRRIEVAQETLAAVYEFRDVVAGVRSPLAFSNEQEGRPRQESETADEAAARDRAFVVFNRIHRHSEVIGRVESLKYQFMATFGREAESDFRSLLSVIGDLRTSAYILGESYWPQQGRVTLNRDAERTQHLDEKHRHEATIWDLQKADDPLKLKLEAAIKSLEERAAPAFKGELWIDRVLTGDMRRGRQKP